MMQQFTDLSNALLQSTKKMAFNEGKFHGAGPSIAKLLERASLRGIVTLMPATTSIVMEDAVRGT